MDEPMIAALQEENAVLRQRVKELEEQQRHFQRLFQATVDQVDALIFLRDLDGRFTIVNEAYLKTMNKKYEEVVGTKDTDLLPPELWQSYRENDRRVLDSGEPRELEEQFPQADGIHTYLSRKYPIVDAQGKLLGLGGISRDITQQKRAETELRTSQNFLDALLDNAPIVVYTKDLEGRYGLISRQAASQIGLTRAEVVGKTIRDLLPAVATSEVFSASEQKLVDGSESLLVEEILSLVDGYHRFLITKFPLRDATDQVYAICGIGTDITLMKRSEEERRRLQEDVIEAQKHALRELSTPLIPIADNVVAMPLIGTIDDARAEQIVEALLNGVTRHRAAIAILDVTGVQKIDAHVANALIRAAHAVELLGAAVVLTGIQPQMAQAMVSLDVRLEHVRTQSTFQSGIEYALKQRRSKRAENPS